MQRNPTKGKFIMNYNTQEIKTFLNSFERDSSSLALYVHLCLSLNSKKRQLLSLSYLSRVLCLGRPKIRKKIAILIKLGLIKTKTIDKVGIEVELLGPMVGLYNPTTVQGVSNDGLHNPMGLPFFQAMVKPDQIDGSYNPTADDFSVSSANHSFTPNKTYIVHEVKKEELTTENNSIRFGLIPNTYSISSHEPKEGLNLNLSSKTKLKTKIETKLETKTKSPKLAKEIFIPEDVKNLAQKWIDWARSKTPSTKFKIDKFERCILNMTKGTQRDLKDIEDLFEFVKSDDRDEGFCYAKNFISPCKWNRVWKNDLTAMDNAFLVMEQQGKTRKQKEESSDNSLEKWLEHF
tara:strand:+ start:1535 stop:2578 length:1044 start_codon:yes stop_codon:yes gene_type:complete